MKQSNYSPELIKFIGLEEWTKLVKLVRTIELVKRKKK